MGNAIQWLKQYKQQNNLTLLYTLNISAQELQDIYTVMQPSGHGFSVEHAQFFHNTIYSMYGSVYRSWRSIGKVTGLYRNIMYNKLWECIWIDAGRRCTHVSLFAFQEQKGWLGCVHFKEFEGSGFIENVVKYNYDWDMGEMRATCMGVFGAKDVSQRGG